MGKCGPLLGCYTGSERVAVWIAALDGVSLAYEERGDGEPVVLIHLAVFADGFAPLMDQPALSGYRLIRYHRRGYGDSAPTAGRATVVDQAADLKGLLEHLGVGRAHVVGHSFGGLVALQLAADHPTTVGSLVLMEAALRIPAGGAASQDLTQRMIHGLQRYREGDRQGGLDEAIFMPDYRQVLGHVLPGSWAQAMRDADTFFDNDFLGVQGWPFGQAEARRITAPVLWVVGSETHPAFFEMEQLLHAWFPHLETARVPGVNHLLHLQQPRPVAETLATFFAQHPLS